jgi:Protein of unknown function, DUF481
MHEIVTNFQKSNLDLTQRGHESDCFMKCSIRVYSMSLTLLLGLFIQTNGSALPFIECSRQDTVIKKADVSHVKGNISATGLIQSGNENRFVASLLSELSIGNMHYEVLPITSIAYSTKPHAQVEGEYLENVIVRYRQQHFFYPAIGLSFEKSFLRKIDYRYSAGITLAANLVNKNDQSVKLGLGVNHEFAQYKAGAFTPPIDDNLAYSRDVNQVYIRLKGVNHFFKNSLVLSYDFFYQPNIRDLTDYRWTLISKLDVPLNNKMSFVVSAVSSYEKFVATNVSNNNFRLTYGINMFFK